MLATVIMLNTKLQNKRNAGFTLIELLVVIGILAVLLAIVLIAINPGRQFGQANDTKRRSDVGAIINAIGAYAADNAGVLPAFITTASQNIASTTAGGPAFCTALVPTYISALPSDPKTGSFTDCATAFNLGYSIIKDANNRVTVSAPGTEIATPIISVVR
jgi:type IV pilus assembly protein PilA